MACQASPDDIMLEQAFQLAGENRVELEKVLTHYTNDSLKLEATKYLICNMPGHYSYVDTATIHSYATGVDSIVNAMRDERDYNIIRDSIDGWAQRQGVDTLKRGYDIHILTADFLIRHIDDAFSVWQHGNWAGHVNFDDFCEFILPYKVNELQYLYDNRDSLRSLCATRLSELQYCDQLSHCALAAAGKLNQELADSLRPTTGLSIRYSDIPILHQKNLPFGQCNDYANMAAAIMRAHGLPVVIDFTPQWANRSLGHAWNVLLSDNGKEIPFGGICDRLGELHKPYERMAKVYRHTYKANPELLEMNASGEQLPSLFRNVFLRDVTEKYMNCTDVEVPVATTNKYAYLLVFNNHDWIPVAFGEVRHGKAAFKNVGCGVMYVIATCLNGMTVPQGDSFFIDNHGNVRYIKPDTDKRQTLTLARKYPIMEYSYSYIPRLKDGEFQASNDANFKKYYVAHRIKEGKAAGQCVSIPDSIPPCRYWRYTNNRYSTFCSIAEVMLYAKGDTARLQGTVIGTESSWGNSPDHLKETVFDGNILTSFDAPRGEGCWAGLDLGKPMKVDHLIYYGRGDGNSVEIGDEYELFYWRTGQWKSLGKQKAKQLFVKYKNVPTNGLYLLRDNTKGIDERIFTFEYGKQVWW